MTISSQWSNHCLHTRDELIKLDFVSVCDYFVIRLISDNILKLNDLLEEHSDKYQDLRFKIYINKLLTK